VLTNSHMRGLFTFNRVYATQILVRVRPGFDRVLVHRLEDDGDPATRSTDLLTWTLGPEGRNTGEVQWSFPPWPGEALLNYTVALKPCAETALLLPHKMPFLRASG
jgi:hypothetical protein